MIFIKKYSRYNKQPSNFSEKSSDYHKSSLVQVLVLILCLSLLSSCSSLPESHPQPVEQYAYYSGGKKLGNHYCKIQPFHHKETQKKVALIGMIHTADASFYKQIDQELDQADIVLTEGIHGLPSMGIHKYFSMYLFSLMKRFTHLQGLLPQNQALKNRSNAINADMNSDEFSLQGNITSSLLQSISLPIMIAFSEPYYLILKAKKSFSKLISPAYHLDSKVYLRHKILKNMIPEEETAEILLPGIIDSRNKRVVEKITKNLIKPDIQHIAVPWGAAHMPELEKELLKSGFEKDNTTVRWIRSIAVKDLKEQTGHFKEEVNYYDFPWLYSVEKYKNHSEFNLLCSLISLTKTSQTKSFSLFYGDLFFKLKSPEVTYVSLLPRFFGKPLLFDFIHKNQKKRFRFLCFFKFGALE